MNHKDIWKIDSAYLNSKGPYEVEVRLKDGGLDTEITVQKRTNRERKEEHRK